MLFDQASTGHWEDAFLDSNVGPQPALRFVHPLRQGIPDLYLLPHPHPLRRMAFNKAANEPPPSRVPKDYIITIHKTPAFMQEWRNAGENLDSPSGNVVLNQEEGAHVSPHC